MIIVVVVVVVKLSFLSVGVRMVRGVELCGRTLPLRSHL